MVDGERSVDEADWGSLIEVVYHMVSMFSCGGEARGVTLGPQTCSRLPVAHEDVLKKGFEPSQKRVCIKSKPSDDPKLACVSKLPQRSALVRRNRVSSSFHGSPTTCPFPLLRHMQHGKVASFAHSRQPCFTSGYPCADIHLLPHRHL